MNLHKKIHRKKLLLSLFTAFIVGIGLNACNEQPVELGYSMLSDTVSVEFLSTADYNLITKAVTHQKAIHNWNLGGCLLGSYDGPEGSTHAAFIARFASGFPVYYQHIKPEDIVSARLHLFPKGYYYGDSLSSVSFDTYKIFDRWAEPENPDEQIHGFDYYFSGNDPGAPNGGVMDLSKSLASWTGMFTGKMVTDKDDPKKEVFQFDPVVTDFDQTAILEWFDLQRQYDSTYDYYQEQFKTDPKYADWTDDQKYDLIYDEAEQFADWGVMFVPRGKFGVRQFQTDSLDMVRDRFGHLKDTNFRSTYIEIKYYARDENGERLKDDSTGEYSGEIYTDYISPSLHAGIAYAPPAPEQRLMIQSTAFSYVDFHFDFKTIPQSASINSGKLILTLDEEQSHWGNAGPDKYLDMRPKYYVIDGVQTALSYTSSEIDTVDGVIQYVFPSMAYDIERIVKAGADDESVNYIHMMAKEAEDMQQIDRIVFYGPDCPDESKRPKLKIVYTTRPDINK